MNYLVTCFVVFLGSGIGGAMRHMVNQSIVGHFETKFPLGILVINITGSALLGLLAGYFAFKGDMSQNWRLFLMVGVCGGYTTFSTFSQDTVFLIERGELGYAALYVGLSVSLAVLGFFGGLWAMRMIA